MLILMDKQRSHILGEVVARGRCGKGELVVEVAVHLLGNRSVVEVVVVEVEVHLLGNKSVVAVVVEVHLLGNKSVVVVVVVVGHRSQVWWFFQEVGNCSYLLFFLHNYHHHHHLSVCGDGSESGSDDQMETP